MELSNFHLLGVAIVIITAILLSGYYAKKVNSADDYNLGGRKQNSILVAGSLLGTIIGGASTIGTSQLAFSIGFSAWWFTLGSGISFFIMGIFYAKPLRSSGLTTIPEFLHKRYGKIAGVLSAFVAILGIFFSIVSSTLTAMHLIKSVFQVNFYIAAFVILILVLGIILFGGIGSTASVGILKTCIIIGTLCFGAFAAYLSIGGFEGLILELKDPNLFTVFGLGYDYAFYKLFLMIIGVVSTQTYVQSLFSATNSKIAAKGCFIAGVVIIVVGFAAVLIGMFMKVNHPEMAAVDVLPYYLLNYSSNIIGGIGIGGLVLSAIGSISGLALGCGTMLSKDIISTLFKIKSELFLMKLTRILIIGILIYSVIFVFFNLDTLILDWNFLSMGLRGITFIPLTLAIFWKVKKK